MSLLPVRLKSFVDAEVREIARVLQDLAARAGAQLARIEALIVEGLATRSTSVVLPDYRSTTLALQTIGEIKLNELAGVRTAVGSVTVTMRIAAWDAALFQGSSFLVHAVIDRFGAVSWQSAGVATISTIGGGAGTVTFDVVTNNTLRVRCTPAVTPLIWSAEVQFTRGS